MYSLFRIYYHHLYFVQSKNILCWHIRKITRSQNYYSSANFLNDGLYNTAYFTSRNARIVMEWFLDRWKWPWFENGSCAKIIKNVTKNWEKPYSTHFLHWFLIVKPDIFSDPATHGQVPSLLLTNTKTIVV